MWKNRLLCWIRLMNLIFYVNTHPAEDRVTWHSESSSVSCKKQTCGALHLPETWHTPKCHGNCVTNYINILTFQKWHTCNSYCAVLCHLLFALGALCLSCIPVQYTQFSDTQLRWLPFCLLEIWKISRRTANYKCHVWFPPKTGARHAP